MAEHKKAPKSIADKEVDVMELEPVKEIEIETKNLVASSKIFIYLIIGLLVYLIFIVAPEIHEKVTWMEKDLNSVLVQSERFKKSTRVFARDNQCASCHLSPDYLLHNSARLSLYSGSHLGRKDYSPGTSIRLSL